MEKLELQYEVIRECIDGIQNLPADYPAAERPFVSGEGQSITETEQLADLYVSFHKSLITLSEETVKYLNNVMTDFKQTDKKRTENGTDIGR